MGEANVAETSSSVPPDSNIDHASAIRYWNSIPANVNGMLGGYPQISFIDLRGSASFLAKLRRLLPPPKQQQQSAGGGGGTTRTTTPAKKLGLGVDCGAGIGRVTEGFLSKVCEVVDIVEPVEKFAQVIRDNKQNDGVVVGDIYVSGLESWKPEKKYDLIWNQWCVGHLTDAQLVEYLKRAADALTDSGLIVLKENVSTNIDENDYYDPLDSAVTRTDKKFRKIFKEAGLNLIKSEEQLGFPKSLKLLPVRFYALRPGN